MAIRKDSKKGSTRIKNIFLSYSRADQEFALKLGQDLRSAGVDIWIDQLDITAGMRWDQTIENALETCGRFMLVLSPESVGSFNVMDELAFALEEGKEVIPILYRPCKIPFRLRRIQYIDFTAEYDASLVELLKILGKVGESGIPPASKIMKPSTKASTPKEKTRSRITPQQEEEVIWRKIVEIVVDNLGIDSNRVTKEASFVYDLGADDLDMVELVMKLEDKFNIEISDTVVDKLITVGDAYQYVLKKLNHKN
jgi:acyl carrier protein